MSGMHSTFSSSVTGDKQHSYALLSAIQQGSAAESPQTRCSSGHQQRPNGLDDAASVSSFGSSVSLMKDKRHKKSSFHKKSTSSLVARQRAAADTNVQVLQNQVRFSL